MAKINVLPQSVAELIAAGEVVERPLSVVKELTENSIDALATSITVEIKNGGVKYIRVTDNGCGIAADEIRTAFVSHATSKISAAKDLERIFTLGFRGEALPSIAAVSRVTVLSRTQEAEEGVRYENEGGKETVCEPAGCPTGTTVVIRDLFFNTPARLKFLKKDVTEGNYVADIVTKAALSHPEIRFTLIRDDKTVLRTPGSGNLFDAIYSIFGKDVAAGLIPCEYSYNGMEVSGYISRPLNNRPNRNMQYFFVNGRSVRLPAAVPALDNAYKNSIMVGKFPMCFLCLTIDVAKTDVNVHPAKTEIRFSDEQKLFETVYYAARSALAKGDTERPSVNLPERDLLKKREPEPAQLRFVQSFSAADDAPKPDAAVESARQRTVQVAAPVTSKQSASPVRKPDIDVLFSEPSHTERSGNGILEFRDGNYTAKPEGAIEASGRSVCGYPMLWSEEKVASVSDVSPAAPAKTEVSLPVTEAENVPPAVRVIGELFKTYIIAECNDKMLLIDQHAAHERMLFNQFTADAAARTPVSQMMLSPVAVTLSGREYAAVIENLSVLEQAGFEAEDFGGGTVLVRACPAALCESDVAGLLSELAGALAEGNLRPEPEKLSWIFHSAACRAAVKAGDRLKPEEMQAFVERLLQDPDVRYCPHGRPVLYELSKYEIEKKFGRIT